MRYERKTSLRGYTARIIKETNVTPYLILFNEREHAQAYLADCLRLTGWEQEIGRASCRERVSSPV